MNVAPKVCLVCMPFNNIHCPSIAMGTLKSVLARESVACLDIYANLELLKFCTADEIQRIISLDQHLIGDYIFSDAMAGVPASILERQEY